MSTAESQIRRILANCINKYAKENNVKATDIQIRFYPFVDGNEIDCRYSLLIDCKVKEELSFTDVAEIWNMAFQPFIEQYIVVLYNLINENEGLEMKNIRIIIQATKEDPSGQDLVAFLYNCGKQVRELKFSEFVQGKEEEE